jgi:chromosome partitioning protein
MRVWSVVSQKGGSGKTTLLLHLAVAGMRDRLEVCIIDLDPQRSAEQWSELRESLLDTEEPTVVHGTPTSLDGMLAAARETQTDLVLVDTPPAVDKSMIYAAAAADLVVVPTRTGVLDEFALRETLDYLKRIGALGKAVIVLNAPGSERKGRAAIAAIAGKEFGVPVLATMLEDQPDLAASLREGKGVTESAPRRKAARSVVEIYGELAAFDRKLARTKK